MRVESARLGWPPSRVSLLGVSVGEAVDEELFVERLVVQAEATAFLRGELRNLHVEVWGPRSGTTGAGLQGSLLRRAARTSIESLQISSVKVDAWHLGSVDGVTLAPFELRDVKVSRAPEQPLKITGEFEIGGGSGDIVFDVVSADGEPLVSVEASVSGVSIGKMLHGGPWEFAGDANGQVFYRGFWAKNAPEHVLGIDGSVEAFAMDDGSGRRLSFKRVAASEFVVDFVREEILLSGVQAADGVLSPKFFESRDEGGAEGESWVVRIPSADVANLQVGLAEGLTVDRLLLRNASTPWETGSLEIEARTGGSVVRLVAQRDDPEMPGSATLSVDDFPLASLTVGLESEIAIDGGLLDLRLTLTGPPGLQGEGEARLREFAASIPGAGGATGEGKLLEVADLYLAAEYLSVVPPRLRVRSAQIVEPRAWVRWDQAGFEVERLLRGEVSYEPPSWLQSGLAGIGEWAGEAPRPETRPSAVGARLSGGAVVLADDSVVPPVVVRLDDVNAVVQGPAGPAGPVDLEVASQSSSLGGLSFRATTGPGATNAAGEVGPISLQEFNPYLEKLIGFSVERGTLGLSLNARLEPEPAMNVRLLLHDIALQGDGERDPMAHVLEAPLPEVVARIQGSTGSGQIELSLQGSAAAENYGLLQALPEALRRAVADLSPKSP